MSIGSQPDREVMKCALQALRDRNLDNATFDEQVDIVSRLGIKVYPSEDVKAMKVVAEVNLLQGSRPEQGTLRRSIK